MKSIVNALGIAVGILPALIVIANVKRNADETWRFSNLVSGLLLIGIAAYLTGLLTDWGSIYDLLKAQGRLSPKEHEEAKNSMVLWLAIVPAALGGIGVNIVVSWLQTRRPSSMD